MKFHPFLLTHKKAFLPLAHCVTKLGQYPKEMVYTLRNQKQMFFVLPKALFGKGGLT
jgi:hypothetical protein